MAYRCTPQSVTQDTPFWLVYGMNVMVLVEVGKISLRRQNFMEVENNEVLRVNLDLVEQVRRDVVIMVEACKQCMAHHFNSKLTLK